MGMPHMGAVDEPQLISLARSGDQNAFCTLVERYMKQAYNIAYGYVQNHDDAADIAQESFVRVFRSIRSFRGDAGFGTWLYRIVTNLALNRIKKRSQKAAREIPIEESGHASAATLPDFGNSGQSELLERALHELPTLQRAAVILRHLNGFSTREVSRILRCSEGTVKTHLHRGLKKLKSKLEFMNNE